MLGAEDAELVKQLTGVDEVRAVERMAGDLTWTLVRLPAPALYTPSSPAEGATESRDELIGGSADIASDPWDGRGTREAHFVGLLRDRFPQLEIRDLSPILDELRMIKSPREIELIRQASRLAGLGLMEAMRSTEPGVLEYQLAAAARYVHATGGARWDAYTAIVGGGTNAWFGHYSRNDAPLGAGDLVLMDYAPDFHYYASDVTRMWPVNGRYTDDQRQLCEFILALHRALLAHMRPGLTAVEIQDEAVADVRPLLEREPFAKPAYQSAALAALDWRGHLSHPVGMSVHDVGNYKAGPLRVGTVIAVDPMMWIEEEHLYVRIEDVVVVTEDGIDNLSEFVPSEPDEIEKLMQEEGVLQKVPPVGVGGRSGAQ
jgi:Xaa-Pro aminopeptidase